MSSTYLTTEEAAKYLKLSKRYLEDLRRKGGGPRYIVYGRAVRYACVELDRWAASRTRSSTSSGEIGRTSV